MVDLESGINPTRSTDKLKSKNMNNHPFSIIRSSLLVALVLAIWSPLQAQTPPIADGKKMMMEGKMAERCQEMKEKKEKMMAEMKAQDAELTAQVAKMNNAPDSEKPGLMASLVTHMAEQRVTRDAQRAKMEEEMMRHMMQHMQMGAESMAQCPMMKGMGDMDANSDPSHKEHHGESK